MAVTVPDRATCVRAFLACGEASLALASGDEVRRAWDEESSCAGMTVGGLTHHLLGQSRNAARLLGSPAPADAPVLSLLDHYARAPWVAASQQGEVDPEQVDTDNAGAAQGAEAVLSAGREALDVLPALLDRPRDPDVVHIPWQDWSLPTADFLTTRMMEVVVHADDLASSVGLETPELDEEAVDLVVALLGAVAVRRHGQVPVVRALSRPQRATSGISAF